MRSNSSGPMNRTSATSSRGPPLPLLLLMPGHSSTPNLPKWTIHLLTVLFLSSSNFVGPCFIDQSSFQNEGFYVTHLVLMGGENTPKTSLGETSTGFS